MIGVCTQCALAFCDADHGSSVSCELALELQIQSAMVGHRLAFEGVGVEGDIPVEAERQERPGGIAGQQPVEVVRAVRQVVAEQHGGVAFGGGHDIPRIVGGLG